jgi:hypothetical protein
MSLISWNVSKNDGSHWQNVGPYSLRVYNNWYAFGFVARVSSADSELCRTCTTLEEGVAYAEEMLLDEIANLAKQVGMKVVKE